MASAQWNVSSLCALVWVWQSTATVSLCPGRAHSRATDATAANSFVCRLRLCRLLTVSCGCPFSRAITKLRSLSCAQLETKFADPNPRGTFGNVTIELLQK